MHSILAFCCGFPKKEAGVGWDGGIGRGFCLCHPAPVQLHYLAAGTQTGGSHSLGLFISEILSFWGPEASAFTSVRMKGWGETGVERVSREAEETEN